VHDDYEQGTTWWTNHYRCPCCRHEWEDGWDAQVDDDCPNCGLRHISCYFSDDGSGTEEERLAALARADEALEQELAAESASLPRPAG
jgi:hypothetical protein